MTTIISKRSPHRDQCRALHALCCALLCALSLGALGCAQELGGQSPLEAKRATDVVSRDAQRLGALSYGELQPIEGYFTGDLLWVSNNPEDVLGYGILSSTQPPLASTPRSDLIEAPLPDLTDESLASWGERFPGCPLGEVDRVDLYLAHILSGDHLSGQRRISVVAQSSLPVDVKWSGELWTSSWSDLWGYKTVRPDWIGARVAQFRLKTAHYPSVVERATLMGGGDWRVIAELRADSLVEGAMHIEVEGGCAALHVIAHDDPLSELPQEYARGDVKWPGWYQGGGHGRAAGLYEGGEWSGEARAEITQAESAFGWRLFDERHSPSALARHGDSAKLLFGGYGVVYESTLHLTNRADQCVSATLSFASFAKLATYEGTPPLGDERTISLKDLERTDPQRRPTMLWNGPISVDQQLRGGAWSESTQDVILTPNANADDVEVASGLTRALLKWDMNPGEQRAVIVKIPVPGYIVAPAGLVFETRPCR